MTYRIRLISPLFSYGATQAVPEIRPASIRGQLRRWMKWIGHEQLIAPIFGSVAGKSGNASKITLRVSDIDGKTGESRHIAHKNWESKPCYLPGTTFSLHLSERRDGLTPEQSKALENTVLAWIYLGSLGTRSTRGAGSMVRDDQLPSKDEWTSSCQQLIGQANIRLFLGKTKFDRELDARRTICDTLHENAFEPQRQLGGVHPRKTSPLMLRLIQFPVTEGLSHYRIVALWINLPDEDINAAIQILQGANKRIGNELANAERIH